MVLKINIFQKFWHLCVDEWFPKFTCPHWFQHVCGRVLTKALVWYGELTAHTSCYIDHCLTAIRVYIQIFVISVDVPFKTYQMLERHAARRAPTNHKEFILWHINERITKKSQIICDAKLAKEIQNRCSFIIMMILIDSSLLFHELIFWELW